MSSYTLIFKVVSTTSEVQISNSLLISHTEIALDNQRIKINGHPKVWRQIQKEMLKERVIVLLQMFAFKYCRLSRQQSMQVQMQTGQVIFIHIWWIKLNELLTTQWVASMISKNHFISTLHAEALLQVPNWKFFQLYYHSWFAWWLCQLQRFI